MCIRQRLKHHMFHVLFVDSRRATFGAEHHRHDRDRTVLDSGRNYKNSQARTQAYDEPTSHL